MKLLRAVERAFALGQSRLRGTRVASGLFAGGAARTESCLPSGPAKPRPTSNEPTVRDHSVSLDAPPTMDRQSVS
jgi:hypothetical protein